VLGAGCVRLQELRVARADRVASSAPAGYMVG
jgi:hypothetical protein